jgi:predicted phosphodiesterase
LHQGDANRAVCFSIRKSVGLNNRVDGRENMSKINWLHISDLHFGLEKEINTIEIIRKKFLSYVKKEFKNSKPKYLFVTGDIFYGPNFFINKNEIQKEQLMQEAKNFFDTLISILNIAKTNVFIVPGNHDTARQDTKKEGDIKVNYINGNETMYGKDIQTYQKDFNKFCKMLEGINYCENTHKLIPCDDADILMLNTSISPCTEKEEAKLSLGTNFFKTELDRIEANHREDESRPLFILAHHSPEYFIPNDRSFLKNELDKINSELYLCGHNHVADVKTIDNINVLICGSSVKNKEIGEPNDVNFLNGSFDTTLERATVYFYTWSNSRHEWIRNRNMEDKEPYYAMKVGKDTPNEELLGSKSESEAIGKFYDFLLNKLYQKSLQKQECVKYFKLKMESLIDLIETEKPEWKFSDKFRRKFNSDCNDLEPLKEIINKDYLEYEKVNDRIKQKINVLIKVIENKNEFGILLYSKSMRVANYLKSLDRNIQEKCTIYVCAGNVRGNTPYRYRDGLDIAGELFNSTSSNFYGFKAVKLIPDVYVDRIIKQGEIHAVLFGTVAIYYGSKSYTHFSNTVGSKLIVDLANHHNKHHDIPCIVIAEQSKALNLPVNLFSNSICENKEFTNFVHPNKELIKKIGSVKFNEFELVDLKEFNKEHIILDQKTKPWANKKHLEKDAFILFLNKILKDRRELSLSEDKKTISKTYLPEDKTIECDIISKLKDAGIAVSDIVNEKENGVELKYYKGIRVFNFLVTLKSLKENEYRNDSAKINQLDDIAKKLLFRCEENQKKIQEKLYEQFKNSGISHYTKDKLTDIVYPENKLIDIIELFFKCFNLEAKMNKQTILQEVKEVHKKFKMNAIVPFRDASTKNMILVYEDLYLDKFNRNDLKRNAEVKRLFDNNKLQDIVNSEIIVDIDFSSCINCTTPYDDEISFKFHEITEHYYCPFYDNLTWNNIPVKEGTNEKELIVTTFIVRFLRFGGRKFLYRVIDPIHHAKRFKYDNEIYYFKKLPEIIEYYKVKEFPETINLFKEIENILKEGKKFFPIIPYDDKEIEKIIKEIAKNETYSDVYPY